MEHDDNWYARQERHCLAAILEAERVHTDQEVAEAEAALAVRPGDR